MSLQDLKSLDLFPVVLSKIYHWLWPWSECRKLSGGDKNYKQRRIREVGKECSYKGACFCFGFSPPISSSSFLWLNVNEEVPGSDLCYPGSPLCYINNPEHVFCKAD